MTRMIEVLERRTVEVDEERIAYVHEHRDRAHIEVGLALCAGGEQVATDTVFVFEPHYSELMSEAPEWAPQKPAGEYRDEDLWWVITNRVRASP